MIQFGTSGRIVGAKITNYLLEKTRIVHQSEGERNFHIFYQLLRGGDKELLGHLNVSKYAKQFRYLTESHCDEIQGRSDAADFLETRRCLADIGIEAHVERVIFELLGAVLHLGNVHFVEEDEATVVDPGCKDHVTSAARLLRVKPADLEQTFCSQSISTKDEKFVKRSTLTEAEEKRDTLAKCVYSCVFNWLVRCLNKTIAVDQPWGFMGVLDIYGFESFDYNGFEQLLINFANETLQHQFNRHIFEIEQVRKLITWNLVACFWFLTCAFTSYVRTHRMTMRVRASTGAT